MYLGVVAISECSVLIAISSPHREDSIKASEWAINTLKATVPIWKKEYYIDGSSWKQNQEWDIKELTQDHNHGPSHNHSTTSSNSNHSPSTSECLSCRKDNQTSGHSHNSNKDQNSINKEAAS